MFAPKVRNPQQQAQEPFLPGGMAGRPRRPQRPIGVKPQPSRPSLPQRPQWLSPLEFTSFPRVGPPMLPIAAKLEVGSAADPLEQEADHMAEELIRPLPLGSTSKPTGDEPVSPATEPLHLWSKARGLGGVAPAAPAAAARVQRKCETCDPDEQGALQRKTEPASTAATSDAPSLVHSMLRSGSGAPLDATTRADFEARLGVDLGSVRVHTSVKAAESAHAINARAYTTGADIVFGAGQYSPGTGEGKRLLAHELTHVVQQGAGGDAGRPLPTEVSRPDDPAEREADRIASTASAGTAAAVSPKSPRIYREPAVKLPALFVIREDGFTKDGLHMAPGRGVAGTVAFLPPKALVMLLEEAVGGGGYRAAVMKNKDEAHPGAAGFVAAAWVRPVTAADLIAPPPPTLAPAAGPGGAAPTPTAKTAPATATATPAAGATPPGSPRASSTGPGLDQIHFEVLPHLKSYASAKEKNDEKGRAAALAKLRASFQPVDKALAKAFHDELADEKRRHDVAVFFRNPSNVDVETQKELLGLLRSGAEARPAVAAGAAPPAGAVAKASPTQADQLFGLEFEPGGEIAVHTSPRTQADYVDNRVTAVGIDMVKGGYIIFLGDSATPLFVHGSLFNRTLTASADETATLHQSYDDAVKAAGAGKYAYCYTSSAKIIIPTIFAPATTPTIMELVAEVDEIATATLKQLSETLVIQVFILGASIVGTAVATAVARRLLMRPPQSNQQKQHQQNETPPANSQGSKDTGASKEEAGAGQASKTSKDAAAEVPAPTAADYERLKNAKSSLEQAELSKPLINNPKTLYWHNVHKGGLREIVSTGKMEPGGGTSGLGGGDSVRAYFGPAPGGSRKPQIEFTCAEAPAFRPYFEEPGVTWGRPTLEPVKIEIRKIRFPNGDVAVPIGGGKLQVTHPDGTTTKMNVADLSNE